MFASRVVVGVSQKTIQAKVWRERSPHSERISWQSSIPPLQARRGATEARAVLGVELVASNCAHIYV